MVGAGGVRPGGSKGCFGGGGSRVTGGVRGIVRGIIIELSQEY